MTTTASKWYRQAYASGSQTVTDGTAGPWLSVSIVGPLDDDEDFRQRQCVCVELAAYLNGGPRPKWMDDLEYDASKERLSGADGLEIEACGPMYDANPPHLFWLRRDDEEAKTARAWLMYQLHR